MSKLFNVSHLTYFKALNFVEEEGLVKGYPPTGFYVTPKDLRLRKIGIIINDGNTSPFVRNIQPRIESNHYTLVTAAIDYICQRGFFVQIIQASQPRQLPSILESYSVYGSLWFYPTAESLEHIQQLNECSIPSIAVCPQNNIGDFGKYIVTEDMSLIYQKQATFLIQRGYRSIGFCSSIEHAEGLGLKGFLLKNGINFSEEYCLNDFIRHPKKMIGLIKKKNISALILPGNTIARGYVYRSIAQMPFEEQPELLLDNPQDPYSFGWKFSPLKIIRMDLVIDSNSGTEGAKMLLNHIISGKDITTRIISYSE